MSRVHVYALSLVAAGAALVLPAHGQAVISTRAGVVHFFEGSVSIGGQPLEARLGKFASIPEGAELRTEQGRAEVLLTPGVFLRIGEKSSVRMITSALSDTRVELRAGSVVVESAEPAVGTSVTLIYRDWNIHQAHQGIYRIDSEPARLRVRDGQVDVSLPGSAPVPVVQGMDLPFAAVLTPVASIGESHDALDNWADGRVQSISADNAIAANIQDPASLDGLNMPSDGFTYFPMLGAPMIGSSMSAVYGSAGYGSPGYGSAGYGSVGSYPPGLYGATSLYQPGFYSLYLPGYTYRPLFLHLPSIGVPRSLYPPSRIGIGAPPPLRLPAARPATLAPVPHPVVVHH
jgi:hypothetical protein